MTPTPGNTESGAGGAGGSSAPSAVRVDTSAAAATPPFGWTGGQFSLVRAVLGLAAVWGFATLMASPEAAGAALERVGLPWLTRAFGGLGVVAALALTAGAATRTAALCAAGLWAAAFAADLRGAEPGLFTLVLLALALHAPAPAGSLDARDRVDPDGGWVRPGWLHAGLWGLAIAAAVAGLASTALSGAVLGAPGGLLALARVVGVVLFLRPGTRPLAFAFLALGEAVALLPGGPPATPWSLALLLLCFEPDWIAPAPPAEPEIVYYDGECGLCHGAVRFLAGEDGALDRFHYAPLFGPTFEEHVPTERRAGLPDSIVLQTVDGRILTQSAAVLHALARLGGLWRPVAGASGIVPRPLRDLVYAGVAKVRKRIFAPPPEACPLLPPGLRGRFLA